MKARRLTSLVLATTFLATACQTPAVLPGPGERFAQLTLEFES